MMQDCTDDKSGNSHESNHYNIFENYSPKIRTTPPQGTLSYRWVDMKVTSLHMSLDNGLLPVHCLTFHDQKILEIYLGQMAPSHYLNQCWLIISKVPCHSPDSYFAASAKNNFLYVGFESYIFEIISTSSWRQWVNIVIFSRWGQRQSCQAREIPHVQSQVSNVILSYHVMLCCVMFC